MTSYKILTINPGSTSTKVALFQGEDTLLSANVKHDAETLAAFAEISDQFDYRIDTIRQELAKQHADLTGLDAVVGRGGGLLNIEGGVYAIGEIMLDHGRRGANGVQHPANLGSQLADRFAKEYGCPGFVVNPPDTDEFQDLARVTGLKGVYRTSHLHALNLKETAIRHAKSMGKAYEDCNFVVCHLGGGISVSAHLKGKMIDGNDIVGGSGPMAPTRCGELPFVDVIARCFTEGATKKSETALCMKNGGLVSHFGTSDTQEIAARAESGDRYAALVWNGMIYQIAKYIGAMAVALHGQVDGILLGGGMVYNEHLVASLREACAWIAPVSAYPGEFEMQAMAAGAARALSDEEAVKAYTGERIWDGFSYVD